MHSTLDTPAHGAAVQSCGPARVADRADDGRLLVELDNGQLRWAQLAMPYQVQPGDEALVLVTGEAAFVIGVLNATAVAEASAAEQQSGLQVERDPRTGRTRLTVPAGDLELNAPTGAIRLSAATGVRLVGDNVDLVGRDQVRATVPAAQQASQLQLSQSGVRVQAADVEVHTQTARTVADEVRLEARTLEAKADDATLHCGAMAVFARTITQTAGDWYQRVTGLVQLLAGRTETTVQESVHLEAERAIYETEKDFKITAEQIHLG